MLVVHFGFQMPQVYVATLYRECIKAKHPNTNPEAAKRICFVQNVLKDKHMELEHLWLGADGTVYMRDTQEHIFLPLLNRDKT